MTKKNSSKDFRDIFTSKTLGLVDRDREAKQLMYALLTREHMLLMGQAGLAKSQFATNAFSTISNSKRFNIHLTKQTTEEYVFGPLNILELKKGNLVHNTKDSILDADFAFLDEFFDASDVLLRSLLSILNERLWMRGQQQMAAQLHTAILTSNYQRENQVTQAILDRIIFKADIKPITAKSSRIKVYESYIKQPNFNVLPLIDLNELKEFSAIIESPNSVTFPREILETYDVLLQEFMKESKKYISQRTANKALKVLKAAAILDNRDTVTYADLEEMRYVFCVLNKDIEEEIFNAVYEKHVGKIEEEKQVVADIVEIESKLSSIPTDFSNLSDQDFVAKMRELNEYIRLLENMSSPTTKTNDHRDKVLERMRKLVLENRDKLFGRNNLALSSNKSEVPF